MGIRKLNFLEKLTGPDIAHAVHQCAHYSAVPQQSHVQAIWQIVRYLIGIKTKGIYLKPKEHSFDVWYDASFAGDWEVKIAADDPMTAKS